VNQAHSITVRDFEDGCPIPAETLGRIYRADVVAVPGLVASIPERTRARLAIFLYGRTHTRELGVRVAATCEAALLIQIAGALGESIYAQSQNGYVHPSHGEERRSTKATVSLAGPRKVTDYHA
jgi:hypothetical protein